MRKIHIMLDQYRQSFKMELVPGVNFLLTQLLILYSGKYFELCVNTRWALKILSLNIYPLNIYLVAQEVLSSIKVVFVCVCVCGGGVIVHRVYMGGVIRNMFRNVFSETHYYITKSGQR